MKQDRARFIEEIKDDLHHKQNTIVALVDFQIALIEFRGLEKMIAQKDTRYTHL